MPCFEENGYSLPWASVIDVVLLQLRLPGDGPGLCPGLKTLGVLTPSHLGNHFYGAKHFVVVKCSYLKYLRVHVFTHLLFTRPQMGTNHPPLLGCSFGLLP